MNFFAYYFYLIASLVLSCYSVLVLSPLLSPLLAAFIMALALQPLAETFEKIKIPRLLSALFCVILLILTIFFVIAFFSIQIGSMDFELNTMQVTYNGAFEKIQRYISETFHINFERQAALLKELYLTALKTGTSFMNNTLSFTTRFLSSVVLFAISLVFLLYYRRFLVSFLYKIVSPKHHAVLKKIIQKIPLVVRNYVFGLSLIVVIVAFLNSIGLMLLGISNAIIFGVMAAILTLIPYIGITIGSIFPVVFAFLTKDSLWYPGGVIAVFMAIQFIEGNFLTPNIVGARVSINPFAAIWGLLLGGKLLGLVGVLFAIPVLAIFKAISDEIPALQPIGYLLGDASNKV